MLNKKRMPDIANMATFRGLQFHSSEWPEDLDLEGKRVAVVGTGASSMQISPAIASRVEQLTKSTGDAILLTHHTVDALASRPPEFIDRGSHALKGKSAAIQVFGVNPMSHEILGTRTQT